MLPYFVANFLSVAIVYYGYRSRVNSSGLTAIFALASLPPFILAALKFREVGTDTGSYIYYFDKIQTFSDAIATSKTHGEAGFWFLNYLGHQISDNYFIIFTFSAMIISACYFYCIKYFNLKTLSLFTLLFVGPYYFQLNGTRQAIAIAIFAVSIIFIIRKQPFHYVVSILLGFLFHKSIIICLPIYYLFKDGIRPRKIALIFVIFLIALVFFQSIVDLASGIDARYSTYGNQQDTRGGLVVSSFNLLLLIWFFFCRKIHPQALANNTFDTLLTLYLLGALISVLAMVLGVDPSGFLRMSIYFVQTSMLLVPMTIFSFRDNATRYIISGAAVALMTLYFYLTTSTFSNLTPYRFNPIIEMRHES